MRAAAVLSLALLTAVPAGAQQPTANPLGQPLLDAAGHPREDAYIHVPLRADDARYGVIDGIRMKEWLMEIDAISLADRDRGNVFWGRNVGTWGHEATQAWVERYFRQYGLEDIRRQSFELGAQWQASSYDISFSAAGQVFTLESARPPEDMESTPPNGLELELVWVGQGSDADYLGRDVRGKAVVVQDIPLPGDIRHTLALEGVLVRAQAKGAAAVGIVYGISDNFAAWQGTGDLPGFNLGYEDGMRIRERLGRGERVTVRIRLQAEQVAGLTAASVWGTLPGRSQEEVLVIAHMDGFFQAASDNASGLAVMIGLLDYYTRIPQSERARTIKFLGSVGHHGGPGTSWLAENAGTALANTAFAINLEHVAITRAKYWGPRLRMMNAVSPMRWWLYASPTVLDIVTDSFNRFNVGVTADMDPGASGEMGRMARLVPSMQVITSPEIKHTEQDTPEWVPAVGLEQIARAYARIIDQLGGLTRSEIAPRPSVQ
jgi:hypothetical protein